MTATFALVLALTFIWLGMVTAISFIEAPLKFQAPGVTIPLGLGIGRLVFRALNTVEAVWAIAIVVAVIVGDGWSGSALTAVCVVVAALIIQIAAIRPALSRRADAVLASPDDLPPERSHAHLWYVGFELIKVVGLVALGTSLVLA
ncbi:hypothetical protein [Gordonia sp. (in: high G+C Gram-positive bacteria)]|uniref:hypothetical protein n=1 Tax=Gordonia sp. (in: high G+C Gram-positive bacteria) TaxID=84139 RepID=UPI003F9503E8